MVTESSRQGFRNFQLAPGTLIHAYGPDVVENSRRGRVKDAAAYLEQVSSGLQGATKKFVLRATKGSRGCGGDQGITNFFNRVQVAAS